MEGGRKKPREHAEGGFWRKLATNTQPVGATHVGGRVQNFLASPTGLGVGDGDGLPPNGQLKGDLRRGLAWTINTKTNSGQPKEASDGMHLFADQVHCGLERDVSRGMRGARVDTRVKETVCLQAVHQPFVSSSFFVGLCGEVSRSDFPGALTAPKQNQAVYVHGGEGGVYLDTLGYNFAGALQDHDGIR